MNRKKKIFDNAETSKHVIEDLLESWILIYSYFNGSNILENLRNIEKNFPLNYTSVVIFFSQVVNCLH